MAYAFQIRKHAGEGCKHAGEGQTVEAVQSYTQKKEYMSMWSDL